MITADLNALELFAAQYFSHLMPRSVPPMHRTIYADLYDLARGKIPSNRYAAIGFRGGAKSTLVCRIFVPYVICETAEEELQLLSASGGTAGLSTKWMNALKKELDSNELLRCDYQYRRGKHWSDDHIQVIRGDGSTIDFYSRGKGSAIRGQRGGVIIDDPQGIRDCRSEAILTSDREWLFSDVLPVVLPTQWLLFISNLPSPICLAANVLKMPGWHTRMFPAEYPVGSGHSVWPEMYSDVWLAQRKAEMDATDPGLYDADYLLRPRVPGNPLFREGWFEQYEPDSAVFRRFMQNQKFTVIGFDGADSTASAADLNAAVTLSAGPGTDPDIYIREVFNLHLTMKDAVSRLFGMKDRVDSSVVIVESRVKEGNEGPYEIEIQDRENLEHTALGYEIVRPDKDKVRRGELVQSIVQRHKIHYDPRNKNHVELINQLVMFNGDGTYHDDLYDAFVHALTRIKEHTAMVIARGDKFGPKIDYDKETGEPMIDFRPTRDEGVLDADLDDWFKRNL